MNVSIVIPTYNGRMLLEKHLPAVLASVRKSDEVIIVDDASSDDTLPLLRAKYPKVVIVEHAKNARFAVSCNDGVAKARHEIIVLLNNDVSPSKNFLTPLLRHFEHQNVFAVGCLEQDHNGNISGRSIGEFRRGMLVHRWAEDQTLPTTLWAAGGSMAVRKSLWEKFGGMDRVFAPAYEEDRDLSYRALKMGYKVIFEPRSRVFHQHESTNPQVFGKRAMDITAYKNMFLFHWKNITDPDLVRQHMLWLPYHLVVGGARTRGALCFGFVAALCQLTDVLSARSFLKKQWKLSDKQIILNVGKV